MKITERLGTLYRLNQDPAWVNTDLFRLMCSPQFAVMAYERLKSKPGNMTPGDDGATLDAVSLQALERLCSSLRDGTYRPSALVRRRIPKSNGGTRPLGIPSPRDKIVHEMARELLSAIYEAPPNPTFLAASHGFRPNRSCHTAVAELTTWQGITWLVEGDIASFFDTIDHHILVQLLRRRIKDERFINLVWKILRGSIREEDKTLRACTLGAPQGGVISPILANIYLHEFDLWARALSQELHRGVKRKANPEWRSLHRRKQHLLAKGFHSGDEEVRLLTASLKRMPTVLTDDPDFCRVHYVRYADDWLIGVTGPKALAEQIKAQAAAFLAEKLKLRLSAEKTLITHAKDGRASFLGFRYFIGSSVRYRKVATKGKRTALKRVTGWSPRIEAPVGKIVAKLQQAGYCASKGSRTHFPCSKKSFVALEAHEIIMRFNAVWRGIYHYFCQCHNAYLLRRVMYTLQYSCLMTLAHKRRRSVAKTIQMYGVFPAVRYTGADGSAKVMKFWRPATWRRLGLPSVPPVDLAVVLARVERSTRSHLHSPCAVCAKTGETQMHHIRALRRGTTDAAAGFSRIMGAINRKQVPLCVSCHGSVHTGRYDGLRLSNLAYVPQ